MKDFLNQIKQIINKDEYLKTCHNYIDNSIDGIDFEKINPQLLKEENRKENYTLLVKKALNKNINLLSFVEPQFLINNDIYFDLSKNCIKKADNLLNINVFGSIKPEFLSKEQYLKLSQIAVENKIMGRINFENIQTQYLPQENIAQNYFNLFINSRENDKNIEFYYSINPNNEFNLEYDFDNNLDNINFEIFEKNLNLPDLNQKINQILEYDKKEIINYIQTKLKISTDKKILNFNYKYNFIEKTHPFVKEKAKKIIENTKKEIKKAIDLKYQKILKIENPNQSNDNFKIK